MITNTMFQSIKSALSKDDTKNTSTYKEIMKLEVGKTYVVRLLPNIKNPEKTFFHFFVHGWESFHTGQYIQATSLQTFGERDPIAEERYRIMKVGSPDDQAKAKKINRSEKWAVNVYVVEDPTTPENKGQVKILRYGRQLQKIIDAAINGEDASEFGARVFDLSENGCNLKIKVEEQGEYPTYVSSRFTSSSNLGLNDKKIDEIYSNVHDLETIVTVKKYDELKELFDAHFYCKVGENDPKPTPAKSERKDPVKKEIEQPVTDKDVTDITIDDPEVADLLQGINVD